MKNFLLVVILAVILFVMFVYFGGGTAVKYVGKKMISVGEYIEGLETQMKNYIQGKINRLQKAKKSLLSSSP